MLLSSDRQLASIAVSGKPVFTATIGSGWNGSLLSNGDTTARCSHMYYCGGLTGC
jgi:hypothetical protein